MKSSNKHVVNALALGIVVLLSSVVLLFWGRKICQGILYEDLAEGRGAVFNIVPSGIVPELDADPNTVQQSAILAHIGDGAVYYGFGLIHDLYPEDGGLLSSAFYYSERDPQTKNKTWQLIYFDKKMGLFVYCDIFKKGKLYEKRWAKTIQLYAGPDGVSRTADKTLGRFTDPLVGRSRAGWTFTPYDFVIFDSRLSRLFRIAFAEKIVTRGPELAKGYRPVQIARLRKNQGTSDLGWYPPYREATAQEQREIEQERKGMASNRRRRRGYGGAIAYRPPGSEEDKYRLPMSRDVHMGTYDTLRHMFVLEKSGQIKLLDKETLELVGPAGYLPSPPPSEEGPSAVPDDLFAYAVAPFSKNGQYIGTVCSSVSREALGLRVSVFDANGRLAADKHKILDPSHKPGGPALMIVTYILENLQPPALGLASYFTAFSFEATAGHRALLVLPNSFVAMFGRSGLDEPFILRLCFALLIILPSILLGLFLAWRVAEDAGTVGLSKNARLVWFTATIAFGLTAYITYRLTRPKITLVTCLNCGKARRPDMENCHRCGSKWVVPELTPPTWRVVNEKA